MLTSCVSQERCCRICWIDVTENRHVGRRSHLRPKDTLAEVTFPSHNAAEYIEHAQLLAMDYPNMITAVAVRNNMTMTKRCFILFCNNCSFTMCSSSKVPHIEISSSGIITSSEYIVAVTLSLERYWTILYAHTK